MYESEYSQSKTPGLNPGDVFTFVSKPYSFFKFQGKNVSEDVYLSLDAAKHRLLDTYFCVYARVENVDRPGLVRIIEIPSEMFDLVQACFQELSIDNMQTVRWKYIEIAGEDESVRAYIVPWKVNQIAIQEVDNYEPIKKYLSKKVSVVAEDIVTPEIPNPCREIPLDNRTLTGETDLFDFGDSKESDLYSWVHS